MLAKNLVISISLSMATIAGVLAVSGSFSVSFAMLQVLILLVTFFFEIHKDLGDIEGDLSYNIRTIPTVLGVKRTIILVTLGYSAIWAFAWLFVFLKTFDEIYATILLITALFGVYMVYLLIKNPLSIERTRRIATGLIGLVILGLMRLFLIS